MPQFQANVYVTLRPSVLDPAGVAVQAGIHHLGYSGVEQVRIGKFIQLSLTATDEAQAKTQLESICDQLLANSVIEVYRFELMEIVPKTPLTTN
ncbi:phosphoribosylformylglycinamidine synthase subunit PurS [Thermosynechococcaceae cyanobacterium BACA0444]|uniref:Phosphoribosylformylglycinamidine synthase subunit PurS n=1 Tax=Pseudocalidococcus azoricus BACA0444 TaxID=2918990 RepID=A0AAE4JZY9_9CYAN|nr:phosphoribosylformylglycinamidine synthase subunit PurS [Pseudocalidococcus azoricus]MDS3861372.1 phosphoribosylformylglycinamidine synthase subunit PurS [Pseudocalidococcus azoricus BACA0444]